MGTKSSNCPYCKLQSVSFTAAHDFVVHDKSRRTLMRCGNCGEAIIYEFQSPPNHSSMPTQVNGNLESLGYRFIRQWPNSERGAAPQHVPENISRFFEQGTSSLLGGNFDAAAIMFRKTLEASTKEKIPDDAGKPLVKRIDLLVLSGELTKDIGQWAHEIRVGGNEAAHDEELYSADDAEALKNFTEAYLRYVYTLPTMVANRRAS